MKIFIVEDDQALRLELTVLLQNYGYLCETSDDYRNMVSSILSSGADLLLLDINLPLIDGYHICREVRNVSELPIIIITSRNNDMDELMGINLGADDFITKPFNTQILLARISSILKRTQIMSQQHTIMHLGMTLYPEKSKVAYMDAEVELTKNELRILTVLMTNKGKIVSRNDLMDELWQSDEFVDDNTLTVNVNRLRKKLEDLGATEFIHTKRGQGYMV